MWAGKIVGPKSCSKHKTAWIHHCNSKHHFIWYELEWSTTTYIVQWNTAKLSWAVNIWPKQQWHQDMDIIINLKQYVICFRACIKIHLRCSHWFYCKQTNNNHLIYLNTSSMYFSITITELHISSTQNDGKMTTR